MHLEARLTLRQGFALAFTSSVTLYKCLLLSVAPFPYLEIKANVLFPKSCWEPLRETLHWYVVENLTNFPIID